MSSITQKYEGVYLLHFSSKLAEHAQHYIGYSPNVSERIAKHKKGQGARITEVCMERGITFDLARVWWGKGRSWERQLKNRKNAKIMCPQCNPFSALNYPTTTIPRSHHNDIECPF